MADTIDLFLDGLSQDELVAAIEACMAVLAERDNQGAADFILPDFIARLKHHTFTPTPDMDFPQFEYWLSAKNYEGPDALEDAPAVVWMKSLFNCLRSGGRVKMLLSYNLDYPLASYEP